MGYQEADVLGQPVWSLAANESARASLRALAASGDLEHLDASLAHKDGSVIDVALTVCPVRDTSGTVVGIGLLLRRVSNWAYLAQSQQLLQELLDGTPAMISVKDLDGRYQMVNARFEEVTGWTRARAIGRGDHDIWPAGVAEELEANDRVVLQVGKARAFPEVIPEADGEHTYLSVKFPLFGSAHSAYGVAAVSMDATELKRSDDAARQAERSYRLLFDANPQPMWLYDAETLEFLAVNEAAITHYGYSRDEFLRMTIAQIRPPEDLAVLRESIHNHQRVDRSGPWRHLRRDGTVIDVEITSHDVVFSGRAARFVLASDVTERGRLQRQVNQSQRLESLGQLAGGVAHDFNNLLAVILNYADFLKEDLLAAEPADGHDRSAALNDIEQIQGAGARAARLTHQLLAFARREMIQPTVLDLNDVVARIESLLRRTIAEDIDLEISLGGSIHRVLMDEGQLEQVLVNLVVNARDAMPDGGTVRIETANVEVDDAYAEDFALLRPGSFVRLRVSDTGIGMTPEVLQRAFEPFFTTKPKDRGTGLGLSTIYGIITQAGGDARIYSEPGRGTTFSALFPTTDRIVSEAAPKMTTTTRSHGETVLVVEDEEAIRRVALRVLERNGFVTLEAANGPEAIEVMRSHIGAINLLLSDIVMPSMNGEDLAAVARSMRPGIAVLFMSGYADPLLGSRDSLSADARVIFKPFTQKDLLDGIQSALRS